MKDTVASLLKMDSKADILSSSSSKKNKDENVAGLFCGEKKLKIVNSFEWGDKQAEKLKSREMKEGWMKNDDEW